MCALQTSVVTNATEYDVEMGRHVPEELHETTALVAATWSRWRERVEHIMHPVLNICRTPAISRPEPLLLCPSMELKLAYQPISKAGSGFVRTMLHSRYNSTAGLSCPSGLRRFKLAHNDGTTHWGWFTLVRDPIERFLSAVAEVSFRRLPHPPVAHNKNGSGWSLMPPRHGLVRPDGTRAPPLPSAGKYPRNGTWRTPSGLAVTSWYPEAPRDRLSMIEFLVTRARPRWDDVHFRSQFASLQYAAESAPSLVSRGFIGDTCWATQLFEVIEAAEDAQTRSRRNTLAAAELARGHVPLKNQRRNLTSTCDRYRAEASPYFNVSIDLVRVSNATNRGSSHDVNSIRNNSVHNETAARLLAEQVRLRRLRTCLAAAAKADANNPYPGPAMETRLRQHYAQDYSCLGLESLDCYG